ncbi:MAG TPA: hypothetical protein VMH39_05790 [Gemmatimonadaceae bacterium]|nr:hypothetical protein [Gemmatimonadaceae bacterium]
MFALGRTLVVGALLLVAMIPVGIIMLAVGLPVMALVLVAVVAVGLLMAIIGLPFLILGAIATAVIAVVFGLLAAFFAIGLVAVKLALLVLLPVLVVGWIGQRLFRGRSKPAVPNGQPADRYQREAEMELDRHLR